MFASSAGTSAHIDHAEAGLRRRPSASSAAIDECGAAAGHGVASASASGARRLHVEIRDVDDHEYAAVPVAAAHAHVLPQPAPIDEERDAARGDGADRSIPLRDALKALQIQRENQRRYASLAAFVAFYTIYLIALFLQRDTRAAWGIQNSISRDIDAADFSKVKDPLDFLDWLQGPFRDLAMRESDGTIGRHNRFIVHPLVLQERFAPERCSGQARFDRVYPQCFTGPPIVEPHPPALDLDYADPANAAAARWLLRITRTSFDLPGEKLVEPGAGGGAPEAGQADGEGTPQYTDEEARMAAFLLGLSEKITSAGQNSGSFPGVEIIGALDVSNATRASFYADVEIIKFLGYVGRSTRSISVKFATYNGHARMAAVVEAKLSGAYTGAVTPGLAINVFRVELYSQPLDWLRLALELLVVVGVVLRLVGTCRDLVRERRIAGRRGTAKRALAELADPLALLVAVGLWIAVVATLSSFPAPRPDLFADVGRIDDGIAFTGLLYGGCDRAAGLFRAYYVVTSITLFLGLLRLYGLLHFQDRMGVLTRTLAMSASDMIHLGGLILVTLIAFGTMGTLMFGTYDIYYSDLGLSLATLSELLLFIDMFNLEGILVKDIALQIVFQWVFGFIATYMLVNLFLAIVYHFYEEARGGENGGRGMVEDIAQVAQAAAEDAVARAGRTLGSNPRGATTKQVAGVVKELADEQGPEGCTSAEELAGALRERYPHLAPDAARRWAERVARQARPTEEEEGGGDDEDGGGGKEAASAALEERLGRVEEALAEGRERMRRIEGLLASLVAASGAGRGPGPGR